jgi:hypothetical protein
MKWAVLTGDIVASSAIAVDALDEIMQNIAQISIEASVWGCANSALTTGFARRGGDGWQVAINRPAFALRLALYIRARLQSLNTRYATRIAIAAGDGTVPMRNVADLNSAHGEAFTDSGRLLDLLDGHTLLAHAEGGAVDAAFRLADHISQGWTQAQARSLSLMLPPGAGPRRVASKMLGISRQAVDQALNGAGYPALMDALEALE